MIDIIIYAHGFYIRAEVLELSQVDAALRQEVRDHSDVRNVHATAGAPDVIEHLLHRMHIYECDILCRICM